MTRKEYTSPKMLLKAIYLNISEGGELDQLYSMCTHFHLYISRGENQCNSERNPEFPIRKPGLVPAMLLSVTLCASILIKQYVETSTQFLKIKLANTLGDTYYNLDLRTFYHGPGVQLWLTETERLRTSGARQCTRGRGMVFADHPRQPV